MFLFCKRSDQLWCLPSFLYDGYQESSYICLLLQLLMSVAIPVLLEFVIMAYKGMFYGHLNVNKKNVKKEMRLNWHGSIQ